MKIYMILALFLLIFSCSQRPKKATTQEYFVTHILSDGTKMFSYVLERSNDQRRKTKGKNRKHSGAGRGKNRAGKYGQSTRKDDNQRMKKRFYEKLELTLNENNFCREGYVKLNGYFNRSKSEIKGQCNEKANEQDKLTFKNQ